ncbi:AAA family ATPase [Parabacteroides segnis]|uniref:AAA family ATPase n=1 Tax=Parabacteroides segnis TaxID=2763058 RepID=UPI003511BE06
MKKNLKSIIGGLWLTPKIWSLSKTPVGEVQSYTLYNDNGNQRRLFQNFIDAKEGDIVIGYEATPVKQIVAIAEVAKAADDKQIYFKKTEALLNPIDFSAIKNIPELNGMEFFKNMNGSFFKLSENEYNILLDLIRDENPKTTDKLNLKYSEGEFLDEVFMDSAEYTRLKSLLLGKKNIILQGAPGVGKTYSAKRLAYSIIGEKNESRIEFIQFHQNYSYEDFIMGYKPKEDGGFELKRGVFYNFCKKAQSDPNKDYFFIIDEINRGNMSKIFGELLMLIENGYRGEMHEIRLAYNDEHFFVPENLYIIGMMNTADRSLAMIDYALRRRFSFFDIVPGFDTEGFNKYKENLNSETFNQVIDAIKALNAEIAEDDSLGQGFCIGHSYFCNQDSFDKMWLENVIKYDIEPMLREYWFDKCRKIQKRNV